MKKLMLLLMTGLVISLFTGCSDRGVVAIKSFQMEGTSKKLGDLFGDFKGAKKVEWIAHKTSAKTSSKSELEAAEKLHKATCKIELSHDMIEFSPFHQNLDAYMALSGVNSALTNGTLAEHGGRIFLFFEGVIKKEFPERLTYVTALKIFKEEKLMMTFSIGNIDEVLQNLANNEKINFKIDGISGY